MAAGILIWAVMLASEVSGNLSQQKLKAQWSRTAQDKTQVSDKAPEQTTKRTFTITPDLAQKQRTWHIWTPTKPTKLAFTPSPDLALKMREASQSPACIWTDEGIIDKRPPIPHKSPVAKIIIPKIKLNAIVIEGVDAEALKIGPGHIEETARPGEVGNMVISGHRVTYCRPFYYLDQLEPGDKIYIETPQGEKYTYFMHSSKVVAPDDVSVIRPTKDKTLTLTTCNPRYSAKTRLVIIAKTYP